MKNILLIAGIIINLTFFSTIAESIGADNGPVCKDLPILQNMDCKDKGDVRDALDAIHSCMKSRFTYEEVIHSASWPNIEVQDSGHIVGGDGECS